MSTPPPEPPRLLGLPDLPPLPPGRDAQGNDGGGGDVTGLVRPASRGGFMGGPDPGHRPWFDVRSWSSSGRITLALAVVFVAVLVVRRPSWPDDPPRQPPAQAETARAAFAVERWSVSPVAAYELDAVVVRTYRYRFGGMSGLSPWDVGMAWGTAAHPDVLSRLKFSYNSRFLYWRVRGGDALSVDPDELADQIANVHIIPANRSVARTIARLGPGDVVSMRGLLVDVRDDTGGEWITSRTRTDRGAGACEILYVEHVDRR